MKRSVKWILGIVAGVAVLAAGGLGYLHVAFPKAGARPSLKIQSTPELLQRGQYLASHVTVCIDCHSRRDWSRFSGPPVAGTEGKGGERFGREFGFPGDFYAKNITPAAIASWSDGELSHAFRAGVSKSGSALFPVMPYLSYGKLCEQDVHAIIAYVRALEPIANDVPAREVAFPMNLIIRTIPKPPEPQACPDPNDRMTYGKYLVTVAACADCHTPADKGQPIAGMELAGGFSFGPMPSGGGIVRSANITPDQATGIGAMSREHFVARFKAFARPSAAATVPTGTYQTVMPWTMYAGMSEADLGAIYDYLRTVKPVMNKVERWSG